MSRGVENTPKLRFPQFSGEWVPMPVGNFATFQRGFDLPNHSRIEGEIPIVSSGGVSGFHNEAKVDRAGLVTGRYGSIGDLYYLEGPHWPLNTSLWVKDFHGNEIKFAYYLLSKIDFKSLSDKTGVPGVNRNDVHKLPTASPKLPEQQKIAAFLGAVDTKIGQLTRKKALLEDYKKSCMQQLFTQKLRFKDDQDNDFPDWEEKKLGGLGDFIGGGTPDTSEKEFWEGTTPWISSSDLTEGDISSVAITRWISNEAISQSATKIVPKGTLLIVSRVGVGKFALAQTELCTSQDFLNFVPNDISGLYLGYWLQQNTRKLLSYCQGTSIKGLSYAEIKDMRVDAPHTDEQKKIADFLSAIDAKISLVADELSAARDFKKGLLQQMFV